MPPSITVADNADRQRYDVFVDGDPAGFAVYRDEPGRRVFTHTEIDDRFGGQGVGGRLARAALDDVRERGLGVVPQCPFIRGYIDRHPEYADLVVG
jgi:predicted GNAT family acetyltransferase